MVMTGQALLMSPKVNCLCHILEYLWEGGMQSSSRPRASPDLCTPLCYTETYQDSCKEATGHQEIILTALDTTRITSCKGVI